MKNSIKNLTIWKIEQENSRKTMKKQYAKHTALSEKNKKMTVLNYVGYNISADIQLDSNILL